ncbi:hypothetical protein HDE_03738 [Halotydeus destructor]|nr:hypothetical protein HDE_03738 [Halotydeus destructor]
MTKLSALVLFTFIMCSSCVQEKCPLREPDTCPDEVVHEGHHWDGQELEEMVQARLRIFEEVKQIMENTKDSDDDIWAKFQGKAASF